MRSTDADNARHFFRSQERLFCFNGQWYFATREGDCGPYPSKEIARQEVNRYISERIALRGFQDSREYAPAPARAASDQLSLEVAPLD